MRASANWDQEAAPEAPETEGGELLADVDDERRTPEEAGEELFEMCLHRKRCGTLPDKPTVVFASWAGKTGARGKCPPAGPCAQVWLWEVQCEVRACGGYGLEG